MEFHRSIESLTTLLARQPGAQQSEIERAASRLRVHLPDDYVRFMLDSNGAEGAIGLSGYLVLWPIEQLVPMNSNYGTMEYAPELVLIGTDGGGTGYAIDMRSGQFVEVALVGLSSEEAEPLGSSFVEFLEQLASE